MDTSPDESQLENAFAYELHLFGRLLCWRGPVSIGSDVCQTTGFIPSVSPGTPLTLFTNEIYNLLQSPGVLQSFYSVFHLLILPF